MQVAIIFVLRRIEYPPKFNIASFEAFLGSKHFLCQALPSCAQTSGWKEGREKAEPAQTPSVLPLQSRTSKSAMNRKNHGMRTGQGIFAHHFGAFNAASYVNPYTRQSSDTGVAAEQQAFSAEDAGQLITFRLEWIKDRVLVITGKSRNDTCT